VAGSEQRDDLSNVGVANQRISEALRINLVVFQKLEKCSSWRIDVDDLITARASHITMKER